MPKEKIERNKRILYDWKVAKLTYAAMAAKYDMTLRGIKSQIHRLRVKDPSLKIENDTLTPPPTPGSNLQRLQVWLEPETIDRLRKEAGERRVSISSVLREVLRKIF